MRGFIGFLATQLDDFDVRADSYSGIPHGRWRLAIAEFSLARHQLMQSASGRCITAFSDAIHNHLDVRAELQQRGQASTWRGHSDAETLLAGFGAWGMVGTFEQYIDMFAFAVSDRQRPNPSLINA